MSDLDMVEVDRIFDILMPRITLAVSIDGELSVEKTAAAIQSLLMTTATIFVHDAGLSREVASVLIPEMITAAYQAMAETLSVMHRDN